MKHRCLLAGFIGESAVLNKVLKVENTFRAKSTLELQVAELMKRLINHS